MERKSWKRKPIYAHSYKLKNYKEQPPLAAQEKDTHDRENKNIDLSEFDRRREDNNESNFARATDWFFSN